MSDLVHTLPPGWHHSPWRQIGSTDSWSCIAFKIGPQGGCRVFNIVVSNINEPPEPQWWRWRVGDYGNAYLKDDLADSAEDAKRAAFLYITNSFTIE